MQKVKAAGYTNVVTDEQSGDTYHFCAYKLLETLYGVYYVHAHVFLVGDHLEVQVSLSYEGEILGS